jgi:hypothetical protein
MAHHARGMHAAGINMTARAFSLMVASSPPREGSDAQDAGGEAASERSRHEPDTAPIHKLRAEPSG